MSVEDDILALKTRHSAWTDRALAEALEIDPSAVAAWRRRGQVPEKYLLAAAAEGSLENRMRTAAAVARAVSASLREQVRLRLLFDPSSAAKRADELEAIAAVLDSLLAGGDALAAIMPERGRP